MGRVAMQSERAEVARDLRALACKMREVADAMWRLHMGVNVDDHSVQMTGAAAIADGWADGIERESGDAGG